MLACKSPIGQEGTVYTTWVCEVLLEASFPPVMAEVRLGGDDDSPALSTLLANDSRAGGAAKPGEVPGVVMEVERRNLEAAAARAAAAPFAAFFAPFCLPLFVISTSCNRAKGFVIANTNNKHQFFCRDHNILQAKKRLWNWLHCSL